uniref:Myb/SANT-like DNA-binding domain-containing protein 4 n=1 Tax=Myripristis murdjan TaxID=586833 RepID=A0A667ZXL2_9TELE
MKQLKRKRKSNYSVRETQTLIREIHKRRDVLFSRQQNTAINELKRQAWEEVAGGVNALGEGELRTAAEVKRRYLDWRALMKRKQLQAELSLSSSSSSSLVLKGEYDPSSPEHEAAALGSGCDQLLDLSGFPKDCHCDWPELAALGEPKSRGEGRVPEVYSHTESGMLASSKAPTSTTNRDFPLVGGLMGTGVQAHGLASHENSRAGLLVAIERQRLEVEKQRLAVETERLAVEKERLMVEKERLRQTEVERERLQLERERLQVERERLRVPLLSQPELREKESKRWMPAVDLETERLKLEKERLQLEKERLQFFKFESGRLHIERERLQVEKERLQLHKDHQGP